MITFDAIEASIKELQTYTKKEIEAKTAIAWATRAIAAYKIFQDTQDLCWLCDAADYDHESREHAGDANEATLRLVSMVLDRAKSAVLR